MAGALAGDRGKKYIRSRVCRRSRSSNTHNMAAKLIAGTGLTIARPTLHIDNTAAPQMAKSMGATRRRMCIDVRYPVGTFLTPLASNLES